MSKKLKKIHLHFDGEMLCGRETQEFETVSEYFEQCIIEDNIDQYYCSNCLKLLWKGKLRATEKTPSADFDQREQ